jgi:putative cell wall-binding protein
MQSTARQRYLVLILAVVFAIAFLLALLGAATPAYGVVTVERIAGNDRYETAAMVSYHGFPFGATNVVVATGEEWADALVGGPLASFVGGPVLLTRRTSLPSSTALEIWRLAPLKVFILGGYGAVDPAVEVAIRAWAPPGLIVERLAGADRYETAMLVAQAMENYDMRDVDSAFFVTGADFPDALTAGPFAGYAKAPILLVHRDSIPPATQDAIIGLALTDSYVLGGEAAVGPAVFSALPSPLRIAGANRYETGDVLARFYGGLPTHRYVATGEAFPDALAAGPVAAHGPVPILLTRRYSLPTPMREYFEDFGASLSTVYIVGGTAAVDESVRVEIENICGT